MSQSNNQIGQRQNTVPFSVAMNSKAYQSLIQNAIKDEKRRNAFITNTISAVSVNPQIMKCTSDSILSASLLAESLGLSISTQLGHCYLVPFDRKEKKDKKGNIVSPACTVAQLVVGYKGYKQLTQRSGNCITLNAAVVKEGELINYDPFKGKFTLQAIANPKEREKAPTAGYYSIYQNAYGYEKEMFMTVEEMLAYADKHSPAFSAKSYEKLKRGEVPEKDLWKYSSFWYKDFESMALKTMIRRLFNSGDVLLSLDMQSVYMADGASVSMDSSGSFVFEDLESNELPEPPTDYVVAEEDIIDDISEPTEPEEISFDEL